MATSTLRRGWGRREGEWRSLRVLGPGVCVSVAVMLGRRPPLTRRVQCCSQAARVWGEVGAAVTSG